MACNRGAAVLWDGEFWLPLQFLFDDDPLPGKFCGGAGSRSFLPVDYGKAWRNSNLSSPGDSTLDSAEESDNEEDFIADLTRKVAQSTLEDDFAPRNWKGLFPSGSPKSTLCGACGCGHATRRGSPNGVTQMTQQQQQKRLNDLIYQHYSKSDVSLYHSQVSSQFNPLLVWGSSGSKNEKVDTVMPSSAWPTLQQAQQLRRVQGNTISNGGAAAMRADVLGSSDGYRRGSSGTGVFWPRQAGVAPESPFIFGSSKSVNDGQK